MTDQTLVQVVLPGIVEPEDLQVRRAARPQPGAGRITIAMEATGVSFAEQQMRRGRYYDQPPFPFVPGYDVVGRVYAVGAGVDPALLGRRVAVLTKVGGWASHVPADARDAVEVPEGLTAEQAETVVVNGITAWQMLHRKARVSAGQTVLVHGASGGVGQVLTQLALAAGVTVIGTASVRNHDALRAAGVLPVDRTANVPEQVRELAPDGVDAIFDHVGLSSVVECWPLLRRGGTLISYGTAATRDDTGSKQLPVLKILARTTLWTLLPNGRSASFFNIWAGKKLNQDRFRARLRADLTEVFGALRRGDITTSIAARLPLAQAGEALRLAESGTVSGKIVLTP
ncbi:medium chain dehydrogenase/reductase family protein [Catenulispora rubra]|uniref:medium chain dehydrogenase/reductase family protein n=1 Tax=Catenulispora rubra TaxID=280293 RepID=UPI001892439C|nr:medium chain dehydrogenase/reductase family protein [Catenulispora rubra]